MKVVVNDLMGRVRDLSMDLRPAMLDDLGLVPALLWLFERYRTQTGIVVDFHHVGVEGRFPAAIETAAFRITQEALTNAARHAGTPDVLVDLRVGEGRLRLQVDDHGRGFSPEPLGTVRSSGLTGMRERARLLGGHLTITSTPGQGTRVVTEIPVPSREQR
jgi:signal transduction histidine kinase